MKAILNTEALNSDFLLVTSTIPGGKRGSVAIVATSERAERYIMQTASGACVRRSLGLTIYKCNSVTRTDFMREVIDLGFNVAYADI
jgi:hypothetical protein